MAGTAYLYAGTHEYGYVTMPARCNQQEAFVSVHAFITQRAH